MGCGCGGAQPQSQAYLVTFPDGTSRLLDDESGARAAVVDAGGGSWTVLRGASADELRARMAPSTN